MNELHLQNKFLIPFFRESLGYREVKPNTVTLWEQKIVAKDTSYGS